MSYSLDVMPNDATLFVPPRYTVWVESAKYKYDSKTNNYVAERTNPALGQIRHFSDLSKAKRRVGTYATLYNRGTKFVVDWTIYEWTGSQYEMIYEGFAGQEKSNNDLFAKRLTKKALGDVKPKKGIDYEVEAAVASIIKSAS